MHRALAAHRRPLRILPAWLAPALILTACGASPTGAPTSSSPTASLAPVATTPASRPTPSTSAASTTTAPATTSPGAQITAPATGTGLVRFTIVYDNTAYDPRLTAAWGFAVLVEAPGGTLLFDTGGDGALLLGNLTLLNIDPESIGTVVLSHGHRDHTGGLAALLDTGATPTVYLPASVSAGLTQSVAARSAVVEVSGPVEILPGIFSTGEMSNGIVEQALVIRTTAGTVVLTGCAHPGIVDIVERAGQVAPGDIALVIGGFHLIEAGPAAIDEVVTAFRDLRVLRVAPTHCTGDAAIAAFAREYGDDLLSAGAGRVIDVG